MPQQAPSPEHVVIVGGGVSGLAAAWFASERARHLGHPLRLTVLEASPRFGGALGTDHRDGFLLEHAADQFLYQAPPLKALLTGLGLDADLIAPNRVNPAICVWARGRLRPFPHGMPLAVPTALWPFLTSDLLTWGGKLRVLAEALMAADLTEPEDESLYSFFARRFGPELADVVVGPVLAGIYSGDPDAISIQATFPRFPAMLRAHGSVLLGAIAAAPAAPAPPTPAPSAPHLPPGAGVMGGASTGSPFRTLRRGVGALIDALARRLEATPGVTLATHTHALSVRRDPAGFRVDLADRDPLTASRVVMALPTSRAAETLRDGFGDVAWHLDGLEATTSAGMYLAFDAQRAPIPRTIGMLMPRSPAWTIRGVSVASHKFPGRAPEGCHLLRAFIGGEGHTADVDLDDDTLRARVLHDLHRMTGLRAQPLWTHTRRYRRQTPQYRVGHLNQVAILRRRLPPNLHLIGNAYSGVGIPACIQMAHDLAQSAWPSEQLAL
jgi:oxygen-dependent protoporphyrinogen oxidase